MIIEQAMINKQLMMSQQQKIQTKTNVLNLKLLIMKNLWKVKIIFKSINGSMRFLAIEIEKTIKELNDK